MTDTKTSEMVERCAAAVRACYPDTFSQAEAEKLVRAAIEAMREPREAMSAAGRLAVPVEPEVEEIAVRMTWTAMIDETLR